MTYTIKFHDFKSQGQRVLIYVNNLVTTATINIQNISIPSKYSFISFHNQFPVLALAITDSLSLI